MAEEKGTNWFQISVAAAGVAVTALLGVGQWQLSRQQNRISEEQHRAEQQRAVDNIEIQVMSLVAPQFSKLRESGKSAKDAQIIVLAAGDYLRQKHNRDSLSVMCNRIVEGSSSASDEIKMQAAEATVDVKESAPWFTVLASLPGADDQPARREANAKLKLAKDLGFFQEVKLYKTKVSNNYAVVLGGQMGRSEAFSIANAVRQKNLATDSFAQQDREWTFVGAAPF